MQSLCLHSNQHTSGWNKGWFLLFCLVLPLNGSSSNSTSVEDPSTWSLGWSDEFNGSDGSAIDTSKWTAQVGGGGWGNNELEYYTARPNNAYQSGGSLVIKAIKEKFTGSDQRSRDYTSARLVTKNECSATYGRFEARIKLPYGQGIWPAFWLLVDYVRVYQRATPSRVPLLFTEDSSNRALVITSARNSARG